ncbi:MAG: hypothetical protein OXU75_17110 [Deltaproteobacteria bacterium]|nr:hypothetical protein [Deltaproteobacteria bacterium]
MFDSRKLKSATDNPDVGWIVGHGVNVARGKFEAVSEWLEVAPMFTSRFNDVTNLKLADFRAILEGRIKSWKKLGSPTSEKIWLYVHGGDLHQQKFTALIKQLDVKPRLKDVVKYLPTYKLLQDVASRDPGALVIGLRGRPPIDLKLMSLDDRFPYDPKPQANYPLSLKMYFAKRHGTKGEKHGSNYLTKVGQRYCNDLKWKLFKKR